MASTKVALMDERRRVQLQDAFYRVGVLAQNIADKLKDEKSLDYERFCMVQADQMIMAFYREVLDRTKQLESTKMQVGLLGATVVFPRARENELRKELVSISQKGMKPQQPRPQQKPENKALKGSPEQKALDAAHKALRDERVRLNLAKNEKSDIRLKTFLAAVETANAAFQAKKKTLQKQ